MLQRSDRKRAKKLRWPGAGVIILVSALLEVLWLIVYSKYLVSAPYDDTIPMLVISFFIYLAAVGVTLVAISLVESARRHRR